MKFNDLSLTAYKKPKRVGRGISAGQGKLLVEGLRAKAQELVKNSGQALKVARIH